MTYEARFTLEEAACQLKHKNDRIELHGEEARLACDLDFSFDTSNEVLALFAPALRGCLYAPEENGQGSLVNTKDHLTTLRFPAITTLKWDAGKLEGAELRFHHGIEKRSDVVFDTVKISKYKLECKEGGTVIVHFQAQVYPTDKQTAFLSKVLLDKVCTLSVTPPGIGD